jgi:hypothetical protein
MSSPAETDPLNLTGVWHGNYTYPDGSPPVSFVATLIESGSHVGGSTHEPHQYRPSQILFALLSGRREGHAIDFIKTCQDDGPEYSAPIRYEGTLNGDGTEIEGRWIITSYWSGKFLMIRHGGKKASVSQKKYEKA